MTKERKAAAPRRSAPSTVTGNAVALSISAMMLASTSTAQEAADEEQVELDTVRIQDRTTDTNPYAEPGVPYKARISGDPRRLKEIADTPTTMSVLTQTQIEDSGKSDLREVLAALPGITLGTGEGGNAFGDRYIIRGHEARSDVFVDGLRDPGMTIRESFALEQFEITKGPSSTFAGRGSTGGAINGITKQASSEYDFVKFQGGPGTDEYYRVHLDVNKRLGDALAVRGNLLYADEEVPDRAPAERLRRGAALSATYNPEDNKLYLSFDYYFLDAKDDPDLGTQIVRFGDPIEDVPAYLQEGRDFLESEVHTFTFRGGYEFSDRFRVESATRYRFTDNGYVMTGARQFTPVGRREPTLLLSAHQGWQEVDYVATQLNAYLDTDIGFTRHGVVLGVEYAEHHVLNGTYDVDNRGDPNCSFRLRDQLRDGYCIYDENGAVVGGLNAIMGRHVTRGDFDSDYGIDTTSVYLMDTVDLPWGFSTFLGVRADYFDYANTVVSRSGVMTDYIYSDLLWNGHAGLVYAFTDWGNAYFSWSTSSNINGGESDLGGNCGYGGICGTPRQVRDSKPEMSENLELGTKWSLLNDKLLLTAAAFQVTKDDVMENVGDDYETLGTLNTGKNRVRGLEFSVVGNVTDDLSFVVAAAIMESEVRDSVNRANVGKRLSNFANEGVFALVVTVDAPINGVRNRARRAGFTLPKHVRAVNLQGTSPPAASRLTPEQSGVFQGLMAHAPTWADLAWLRGETPLPVLVKGILHPDDALRTVDLGLAGMIVSNHGGRTLDGLPASITALPRVRTAVGADVPVLLDGGIRRGTDVFKALALGADAVLVGRPQVYALAVAGALGVAHILRVLREELEVTMALTGCPTLDSIDGSTIRVSLDGSPEEAGPARC